MSTRAESTIMFREAAQAPEAVRAQLAANAAQVARLAERLRATPPRAVVTCARGSSDHAATFARYLIETHLGLLTSSAAPSVSSVYATATDLAGTLMLTISQSGASPDLLAVVGQARKAGAHIVALVNAEESPLAQLADELLPLHAGPERSVAATKSFLASLAAIVQLVAAWSNDRALAAALESAPQLLTRAWQLDWNALVTRLTAANNLYVIGRGLGLGVAQEAALKLKETSGLHAEAVSAAELSAQGADVLLAGTHLAHTTELPTEAAHPVIEPLLFAQSFYRAANALALARGHDPDAPPHLRKVTETL